MVTLYHFDHPQSLQDEFFGWESDKMIEKFVAYADYVFKEYGNEVSLWTTINEPNQYCMYFNMLFALSGLVKASDVNIHRCMHNTILAHSKAYRLYQREYYPSQKGRVGATALLIHAEPQTASQQDIYAADAFNQLHCGQVLHPVVYGDYPDLVKKLTPSDQFIPFTPEEKAELEGSTDFIALNIYDGVKTEYSSTGYASRDNVPPVYDQLLENLPFVKFDKDGTALMVFDKISPEIMTRSLLWTWSQYGLPIVITENGYSGAGLQDHDRAAYFSVNLRNLVSTIRDYGVKVWVYCAWSLIDAFEWSAGFNRPFGLVYVDYKSGSLDRTLKQSSEFFIKLANSRKVPYVAPSTSATTVSSLISVFLPIVLLKISWE
ncbi:beta-glucosidase 22-like isoform X2 [Thrips palmi]|nr:beta-glucosidase 22-like isoform X2 [Thrips palmi]